MTARKVMRKSCQLAVVSWQEEEKELVVGKKSRQLAVVSWQEEEKELVVGKKSRQLAVVSWQEGKRTGVCSQFCVGRYQERQRCSAGIKRSAGS